MIDYSQVQSVTMVYHVQHRFLLPGYCVKKWAVIRLKNGDCYDISERTLDRNTSKLPKDVHYDIEAYSSEGMRM
jgi:hypothetical protein